MTLGSETTRRDADDERSGPGAEGIARRRVSGRSLAEKGWVPIRYWILWGILLALADLVFYVLLTPLWLGLRALAWSADWRARRRR